MQRLLLLTLFFATFNIAPAVMADPVPFDSALQGAPDADGTFQPSYNDALDQQHRMENAQKASDAAGDARDAKDAVNSLATSCVNSAKDARMACSTLSAVTGLGGTEAALLGTLINSQLPALITQLASSGKSAAQQCKIQQDVNKVITAITTLKAGACTYTMLQCKSACKANLADVNAQAAGAGFTSTLQKDAIRIIGQKTAECGKYTMNIGLMAAQAGYGIINTIKAGKCVDDMTAGLVPTPTPFQLADSNVDCSNPNYAATNMVCICRNSPSDPMCAGFNPGGIGGGGSGTVGGGSIATPGLNGAQGEDGVEIGETPKFEGTGGSNQAGNGGGGGGLPGGGGGAGGLGGGEGEGGGGSGLDKNVIQGTSGGGGGGISPLTAGGGGGSGMKAGGGGGAGGASGFDFKKYLPKSLFKNRGLAGMTVPSTDGVTGPMGPSLWEKVTNRYQVKKSTLIQDK